MNWGSFGTDLTAAVRGAWERLLDEAGGSPIYAVALTATEDGTAIAFAGNTEQAYAEHLSRSNEARELTWQDWAYYRWSPAEWRYEGVAAELFCEVNRTLGAQSSDSGEDFASDVTEMMIRALFNLKRQERRAVADVTAFVSITDSDDAEAIENASAQRVNDRELTDAFLARYDEPDKAP